MQFSSCLVQPIVPAKYSCKTSPTLAPFRPAASRGLQIKAAASGASKSLSFNYNSPFSVFPAEACETVGEEACAANIFPEVKLNNPETKSNANFTAVSEPDRDYFDYNSDPISVLRAEACDDLGGEFCQGL